MSWTRRCGARSNGSLMPTPCTKKRRTPRPCYAPPCSGHSPNAAWCQTGLGLRKPLRCCVKNLLLLRSRPRWYCPKVCLRLLRPRCAPSPKVCKLTGYASWTPTPRHASCSPKRPLSQAATFGWKTVWPKWRILNARCLPHGAKPQAATRTRVRCSPCCYAWQLAARIKPCSPKKPRPL